MAVEGKQMASTLPWPGPGTVMARDAFARDDEPGEPALLTADLHEALSQARIQTLYQPIVRMADRCPVALEVLARLHHPLHGMLLPGRFIPPMEAAGLGCQLTEAVLLRAFDDWGGERLEALNLMLAFNFPLEVLLRPEALSYLDKVLTKLYEAIQRLRAIGYGIAIDDVGPDIRDHRALLDLQFTVLKLDKKLVGDALDDPSSGQFLADAIAAAGTAGMTVTAEGVEDEATWTRMAALGVDHAQGYLVAHPLPAAAILPWYRDWCSRHVVTAQLR
jgi:EAL domain-containing protein (putative c-di-GMP-specific phosphodiesterase class I)